MFCEFSQAMVHKSAIVVNREQSRKEEKRRKMKMDQVIGKA